MAEVRENKMGVLPVKRLIVSMSLPMMVSMLVQALYNIVDSIFVSQISESALTAVTLAFPLQNLMIAVATGTGVGVNAMLSKSLGEKRTDLSDSAANTSLLLAFLSSMAFVLIGIFGSGAFIRTQTSNPEIIEYGSTYLTIVSCLSIGLFFQVALERLLQSTGQTIYSMVSQLTGAVFNIIFDPILIFGLGFFPKMGVSGAALATVLGQMLAAVLGVVLNLKKNTEIHFSMSGILHPRQATIRRIYVVGVPSIAMVSIGSLMSYTMNLILISFSETAAAVFGAYFKLQSFFFMPVFGLNNGLIPVLAYNYGAQDRARIDEALSFSVRLAIAIMLVGTFTFEVFPTQLLGLFNASENMRAIGITALRIIGIHFPLAGACITLGSVFQAFARSIYSLIISIARQLLVLIPVAWLLGRIFGTVSAVWWAFPIAETASLLLSILFFRKVYREVVEKL